MLERAFPGARYVHLIRDGRDAALSFLALTRRPSFNWARPRGVGSFAVQWRREVEGARRFGRERLGERYVELRYEDLVSDPEDGLRATCPILELEFDPAMLEYHEAPDAGTLRDHPKLAEPPTPGLRSWRDQMAPRQAELFEAIAGDLLTDLGYDRAHPEPSAITRLRAGANRAALGARAGTWHAATGLARRSPAWRLRQSYSRRGQGQRDRQGRQAALGARQAASAEGRSVEASGADRHRRSAARRPGNALADRVAQLAQALARDRLERWRCPRRASARASGRSGSGRAGASGSP